MARTIESPEDLASTIKAAQVDTGAFYHPFTSLHAEQIEVGWDGAHFVLRTDEGPRVYGEEVIAGILPLMTVH